MTCPDCGYPLPWSESAPGASEYRCRVCELQEEVRLLQDSRLDLAQQLRKAEESAGGLDPDHPFERLLLPILELSRRKRADYANEENVFRNFERNAEIMNLDGYTALEDCLSMVSRKLNRITNLRGREASNETVVDSFLDLATYSILAYGLALRESEQ